MLGFQPPTPFVKGKQREAVASGGEKHHWGPFRGADLPPPSCLPQAAKCHALLRTSTLSKRRHTTAVSCTSCLSSVAGTRRVCSPLFCFFHQQRRSKHPIMPLLISFHHTTHHTTHTTDTGTFNQAPRLLLRADSVVIAVLEPAMSAFLEDDGTLGERRQREWKKWKERAPPCYHVLEPHQHSVCRLVRVRV